MKTLQGLVAVAAIASLTTGCSPLDQTAIVTDRYHSTLDPCQWEDKRYKHDEWPINKGAKFKLERRDGARYFIDVKENADHPLEKADMFVVNASETAVGTDYCVRGGAVRKHVYALGITEVPPEDEQDTQTLRALIYFPMRLEESTPAWRGDAYYLMLLRVYDDPDRCAAYNGATKIRCMALHRIGVLHRQQVAPDVFADAIKAEIQKILPDDPYRAAVFHNGVIHGNF
jgi:hypothetical protein